MSLFNNNNTINEISEKKIKIKNFKSNTQVHIKFE